MLTTVAIGLLCGASLGMRFRIVILVPAHAAALVVFACLAASVGQSTHRMVMGVVAWSLCCQAGYLAVTMARHLVSRAKPRGQPVRRAPF